MRSKYYCRTKHEFQNNLTWSSWWSLAWSFSISWLVFFFSCLNWVSLLTISAVSRRHLSCSDFSFFFRVSTLWFKCDSSRDFVFSSRALLAKSSCKIRASWAISQANWFRQHQKPVVEIIYYLSTFNNNHCGTLTALLTLHRSSCFFVITVNEYFTVSLKKLSKTEANWSTLVFQELPQILCSLNYDEHRNINSPDAQQIFFTTFQSFRNFAKYRAQRNSLLKPTWKIETRVKMEIDRHTKDITQITFASCWNGLTLISMSTLDKYEPISRHKCNFFCRSYNHVTFHC